MGIDESDASRLALIYAVEEAVCRQTPLRVVTAFESAGRFGDRYSIPIPVSDEEIARREEVATRKMVDEVLGAAESPPEVRIVVMAGATGSASCTVSSSGRVFTTLVHPVCTPDDVAAVKVAGRVISPE